ncbi:MAG: patatin-like phospholipase family protein [bacterium]|nr:patatin-like phospholipase family protein [bacterium]
MTGLVLTGGGARAAYQAGVLRGVIEIWPDEKFPFRIITGTSAGAINGGFLGASLDRYRESIHALWDLWNNLELKDVFDTGAPSLFLTGLKMVRDLVLGGLVHRTETNHLLDNTPLKQLIERNIDCQKIQEFVREGILHGFAVTATNYSSGTAVTFFDGASSITDWIRTYRMSRRTTISPTHILASAAVPLFFPPVSLEKSFYGDGSLRSQTPLSPAIHLGAKRLFVIGVRYPRSLQTVIKSNEQAMSRVVLADIAGVMLNATFLDAVDADLERLERINQTLQHHKVEESTSSGDHLRQIPTLVLRPSQDLGALAAAQLNEFPRNMRYLFRGLGVSKFKGWELLSYFAFHRSYTAKLLTLGYQDALNQKEEILSFLKP